MIKELRARKRPAKLVAPCPAASALSRTGWKKSPMDAGSRSARMAATTAGGEFLRRSNRMAVRLPNLLVHISCPASSVRRALGVPRYRSQYSSSTLRILSRLMSIPGFQSRQFSISARPGKSGMRSRSAARPFIGTSPRMVKLRVRSVSRSRGPKTKYLRARTSPALASKSLASHELMRISSLPMSGGAGPPAGRDGAAGSGPSAATIE